MFTGADVLAISVADHAEPSTNTFGWGKAGICGRIFAGQF
jgi:hypothetical protein